MAIEEFIKRFEKNNAFEAVFIETGCKSAKSNLLLEDNPMAIEEFIKRFEKNNAFEALFIETGCKSAKSNT